MVNTISPIYGDIYQIIDGGHLVYQMEGEGFCVNPLTFRGFNPVEHFSCFFDYLTMVSGQFPIAVNYMHNNTSNPQLNIDIPIPRCDKNSFYKFLGLIKISLTHQLAKSPRGVGLFPPISDKASKKKKPHPLGLFASQ